MTTVASSTEHVCVVDGDTIVVYAARTLKQVRRIVPTEERLVHLFFNDTVTLAAVDALGTITLISAATGIIGATQHALTNQSNTEKKKPTIKAARVFQREAKARTCVWAGHCLAGGQRRVVLLTGDGSLMACPVGVVSESVTVGTVPGLSAESVVAAVGPSGAIAVGHRGERWVRLFDAATPVVEDGAAADVRAVTVASPVDVAVLALPEEGRSLAIGGQRGEIVVFHDALRGSHFAEHWHHTPVSCLAFAVGGHALYSGAGEGVLCVWSMSDFSMRKLHTGLGSLHGTFPAIDKPSELTVTGGIGQMVSVDLIRRQVLRRRDGVHWSSSRPCTGVVTGAWRGGSCIVLTGLPHVVRYYDPDRLETSHAIQLTQAAETVADLPDVGVQLVALARDGKLCVCFETGDALALPSALRWWRYNDAQGRHEEIQTVYHPHGSEPLLAVVSVVGPRGSHDFLTLSRSCVKYWSQPEAEEGQKMAADTRRSKWHCDVELLVTPGASFAALAVSADNSVMFIAEGDTILAIPVSDASEGNWKSIVTLSHSHAAAPFIRIVAHGHSVIAHTAKRVHMWSLSKPAAPFTVECEAILGVCVLPRDSETVAAVLVNGKAVLKRFGLATLATIGEDVISPVDDITFVEGVSAQCRRLALVSARSGLRIVTMPQNADSVNTQAPVDDVSQHPVAPVGARGVALASFFAAAPVAPEDDDEALGIPLATTRARAEVATAWLTQVVGSGEAYSAPPMRSVLAPYLDRLLGSPEA